MLFKITKVEEVSYVRAAVERGAIGGAEVGMGEGRGWREVGDSVSADWQRRVQGSPMCAMSGRPILPMKPHIGEKIARRESS